MDCKIGPLIDLSESPETKQVLKIPVAPSSPCRSSLLGETSGSLILNERLGNELEKATHSSPMCGVLIDLDFRGLSPNNGSGLAEASIQSCESSVFAELKNSGLTLQEKSTAGSFLSKNEMGSTSSSRNVNFSWSPSIICKDADLLENEEFDFKFMSSISPERKNIPSAENVCQKCTSQKKPPQLSTPQKDWSLLYDAFIYNISEEAAKVVTRLSAKKVFPGKSEGETGEILSTSLNSSFSVTQPSDLGVKNPNSLLDGNNVLENSSSNSGAVNFHCTNKNNPVTDAECVGSNSELLSDITEFAAKSTNNMRIGSTQSLDDCIMSNLNAMKTATSISPAVNVGSIMHAENKENIPVSEAEICVFSDNSSSGSSVFIVNAEELIVEEQLSSTLKQKCEILNSPCPSKEVSPLIRRETFTVKTSPLQESIKSASKYKTVNKTRDGRAKADIKYSTPKVTAHMRQQSVSRHSFSHSKQTDLPSQSPLTCKETYTISPGSNTKNLPDSENKTSAIRTYSTPNTVSRVASFAGKMKSLSCKVSKSKSESSPAGRTVSSSNSPKGNSAYTFKTPTLPKRTSMFPSKLGYSQSHGAIHSKTEASTAVQHSSPAIMKSNSFKVSACSSLTGSYQKRPVHDTKQRASSAGEITNSGHDKRRMPLKAIAPISNMIKATSRGSPGADVSNICGSKGKTTPSLANQGLRSERVNAVLKSEPTKSSNFHGTPKSTSTRSRPRFSSQNDSTPTSLKNNVGVRRSSFLPTPKYFTSKRSSEKFCDKL